MNNEALLDRFGEIIADTSDAIDDATMVVGAKMRLGRDERGGLLKSEEEENSDENFKAIKARVKALAKEYLSLRAAAVEGGGGGATGGGQSRDSLRDALLRAQNEKLQARADAADREIVKLKRELKEAKEDCALLVRAAQMAREEFKRLDKLDEEDGNDEEDGEEEDDDVVTVKSLASSGGATYGSGVQVLNTQDGGGDDEDEDEDDGRDDDDDRGPVGRSAQSLHDMLDLDDQYNAALEKLRMANISSTTSAAPASYDNKNSTYTSPAAAIAGNKSTRADEVTETAKAAAMFAATAALYSHSGLNAASNSGGKPTNRSSTSEDSSGTTSKSGGQVSAAALCVDDESEQGQVFRTPVMVVSDHPDALSSSDEEKDLDREGSLDAIAMQNALDRVFLRDDDENEVDSPSGFETTTTKKKSGNKMSFLNALPP
jgi:hypothetical protein